LATFLLAQTSDNAPGGALLSLWFPLGLFIIVAAVLWAIYARPHGRVPPRPAVRSHGATAVAGASSVTPASAADSRRGAGSEASAQTAAGDSDAQRPATPPQQPGTDDTGHQR
jgi:hypothetical protein